MANGIRINNLNQATSLNDTDTITIIQDDENKKASISLLDKGGTYIQSVVNTIPDLITTSKANVETTKQAINEKFGDDKFSAQIVTSQAMSSVGVSDDGSVDVSSQVQDGFMESAILKGQTLVNLVKKLNDNNVGYSSKVWKIQGGGKVTYSYDTNKGITLANTVDGSMVLDYTNLSLFKPNTDYTLFVDVDWNGVGTAPSLTSITTQGKILNNGLNIIKFTTVSDLTVQHMCLRLGYAGTLKVGCEYTFNNIMVLEGDYTNADIPYFEGMQSVKNSQTLVNIITNKTIEQGYIDGSTGTDLFTTNRVRTKDYINVNGSVTIKCFDNQEIREYLTYKDGVLIGCVTLNNNYKVIKSDDTFNQIRITFRNADNSDITPSNLKSVILEGDYTNVDIPYFEGMQSIKMPILTTVGKNLFDESQAPEQLSWGNNVKKANVNENTTYVYSSSPYTGYVSFKFYDNNGNETGKGISIDNGKSFTTPPNTSYLKCHTDNDSLVQIEEGTQATPYEPYKSSILSCNEDVTLRGIDDVQDELNCLTRELTERVGETVLDGSEDEGWVLATESGNLKTFRKPHIFKSDINDQKIPNIICDKLKLTTPLKAWAGYEIAPDEPIELSRGSKKNDGFDIIVDCSRATTINGVDSFKQWLSQNPITIQYELETESVKTVDLNSSNGDVKTPIVYKNGHILLQSDGLIPELHYSIPVSYSGLIAQNTMINLKHSWRLDELEIMAYTSIVNSQYDSLILVATAETNEVLVSSDYVPDESLYNMLKVLVNANALENDNEKINVFYLYGKLSDEMYIDLIMGDDM